MDTIVNFVRQGLTAIVILVAGYILGLLIRMLVSKVLARWLSETWANFVGSLTMLAIILWGIQITLNYTQAAGAIVILGTAITGAFAIGSERLAADIMGGLTILFSRPFQIGDYVSIGDLEGDVISTSLATTILESFDGTKVILRNASLIDSAVVNYSVNPAQRISITIPVPANEDLEKAASVLMENLPKFEPQFIGEGYPASVLCEGMNEGYAEFQVRVYIPTSAPVSVTRTKLFIFGAGILKKAGIGLAG
jgi:small conductance mechanosensitive channel